LPMTAHFISMIFIDTPSLFQAGLERVAIQDSSGLENLIQAPFRLGAMNVGGSSGSARPSMGADGAASAWQIR
jgi:hypothetical protein